MFMYRVNIRPPTCPWPWLKRREQMTHYSPISPCVGIICFRGADVLLIKRGKPPKQGEWSIPGGHIEFGEQAEAAALRELKEETGVEAELCGLVDVVDGIFPSKAPSKPGRHYLLCDYAARWINGEPEAATDASHAAFISSETLSELPLWDETRRVIEAARAMLEDSL